MAENPYRPQALKYWCRTCRAHTPFYEYSRPAGFGRAHVKCRQCDTSMDSYRWRRMGCGCIGGGGLLLLLFGLFICLTVLYGEPPADVDPDESFHQGGLLVLYSIPLVAIGLFIGYRGREWSAWARQQKRKTSLEMEDEAAKNPIEIKFPPEDFETIITYDDPSDYKKLYPEWFEADGEEKSQGEETGEGEALPDVSVAPGENLEGAKLAKEDLKGAKLQGANLKKANLEEADLQGADLRGADLGGANLTGVNLSGANLQGADLNFADFSRANIQDADLRGVQGWRSFFSGAIGTPAHLPGDPLDE